LLRAVEEALAAWCLTQLHVDDTVLRRLYRPHRNRFPSRPTAREVDGQSDDKEVKALWGSWLGREREFFIACARLVEPLQWSDVLRIAGVEVAVYAQLTREAHFRRATVELPERPNAAFVQITPRGERIRLATYSTMDELEVPAAVGRLLPYFNGRPLGEALEAIKTHERMAVDASFVRKLTDFGVLRDDAANDAVPR
jgi:hypothetical protein